MYADYTASQELGNFLNGPFYNQVYRELLTYILADPRCIDQANFLLWVAHNLERAADRVTNICERVIFTVTGKMEELDVKEGVRVSPESAG
jgi:phosphate uptake regulator